jgi:FKBP-type peptidyl-prolyl cis-trans isomerase
MAIGGPPVAGQCLAGKRLMHGRTPIHGGRRQSVYCAALAALSIALPPLPVQALPVQAVDAFSLSSKEQEMLVVASKTDPGVILPSGVRVIELTEGTGPLPVTGNRVYMHFKVWVGGFGNGVPADSSFQEARPYSWLLGQPDARIMAGFDDGAKGMREGGWRRLVVPAVLAYGQDGLPQNSRGAYLVPPK